MNLLRCFYPGDSTALLVANVFIQIAVVVVLSLAAGNILARRNAAMRHAIWLSALTWVCAAPAVAFMTRSAFLVVRRQPSPVSVNRDNATSIVSNETTIADPVLVTSSAPKLEASSAGAIAPVAPLTLPRDTRQVFEATGGAGIIVWAVGSLFLAIRLSRGLGQVATLRRHLQPADDIVDRVGRRVCQTLGIASLPHVALCQRLAGPAAIGVLRPIVVLPIDLAAAMTDDELHDALTHECGHVVRHDYAVGIVQKVVSVVFWPHPLIHVLNQNLAQAREEVCDNLVLRGNSAPAFARTLLSLALRVPTTSHGMPVVGILGGRWRLEDRIAGLLNPKRIIMTRTKMAARVFLAAFIALVGVAAAFTIPHYTTVYTAPTPEALWTAKYGPDKAAPAVPVSSPNSTSHRYPSQEGGFGRWYLRLTQDTTPRFADGSRFPHATVEQHTAHMDLTQAQLTLGAAIENMKRLEKLVGQATVPVSEVESAVVEARAALLKRERAEAQLEQSMNTKDYAKVLLKFQLPGYATWDVLFQLPQSQGGDWETELLTLLSESAVNLEAPWRVTFLRNKSYQVAIRAEPIQKLIARLKDAAAGGEPIDTKLHWGDVILLKYEYNDERTFTVQLKRSASGRHDGKPIILSTRILSTLRGLLGDSTRELKQAGIDTEHPEEYRLMLFHAGGYQGPPALSAGLKEFLDAQTTSPELLPDDLIEIVATK